MAATESMVGGGSGILLGGVNWLPWVVNTAKVQGMEPGEPLYDLFRSHGFDG